MLGFLKSLFNNTKETSESFTNVSMKTNTLLNVGKHRMLHC